MSLVLEYLEGLHVSLIALAVVVLGFALHQIYVGTTSKLSRVPGPWYSAYTSLVFKWYNLKGKRWDYVHSLHQKYGPVVRVGPSEVSAVSLEATKEVYKMGSRFYKTDYYGKFKGAPNAPNGMFFETDPKLHGTHRGRTAHQFSEKSIKSMESYIRRNIDLTVQRMSEDIKASSRTDAFKWFLFMATDVIGEASFGESFQMLETGQMNQYARDLEYIGESNLYRVELPWLITAMRPFGLAKRITQMSERMGAYANASIKRYWDLLHQDPENVKPTLLTKTYGLVEDGTLPKEQLNIDARVNIIAGTDTTAMTAAAIVYLLVQHPDMERRLIKEVASLPDDFCDDDCRQLAYLDQVIQETLRVRPPIGMGLPRFVPPEGTELSGYYIPGGSVIGIPAYSLHRDATIFPDPEAFKPERWEQPTADMKDAFVTFGGGSRYCIGVHLAKMELRLAISRFYRRFSRGVEFVPGFDAEASMEVFQSFLSSFKGKSLLIQEKS